MKSKVVKYDGKYIPLVHSGTRWVGVCRENTSWFFSKPKYSYDTWSIPEYIFKYCSCDTYREASVVLDDYLNKKLSEEAFIKELNDSD